MADDVSAALDDHPAHDTIGDRDLTHWPTPAGRSAVAAAEQLHRRLSSGQVLLVSLAAGLVVLALATVAVARIYDAVTDADGISLLDRPALDLVKSLRTDEGNEIAGLIALVGGRVGMPVLATVVAVGLSRLYRSWSAVVLTAVTAAGSVALTVIGKAVVGRIRPPLADALPPFETSPSFPSGHTLNAVAIAGIIAYLVVRRLQRGWERALTVAAAVLFSVVMGLSRVYLAQHWLTDVLVAFALGVGWVSVVIMAHRIFLTLRRRHHRSGAVPG